MRGSKVTGNPYACEAVEAVFYNCIESFNANCGHLIPVVQPFLDVSPTEIRSNAMCYHQKFDQYFNQDGQCSYEDFKQYVYSPRPFTFCKHHFFSDYISRLSPIYYKIKVKVLQLICVSVVSGIQKLRMSSKITRKAAWDSSKANCH